MVLSLVEVVIGLGSNLGDRRRTIARASEEVGRLGELRGRSALYETAPLGPPQPAFLNGALHLSTELEPVPLLSALLAIERRLGRVRRESWGPRTIDLDILWFRERSFESPELSVPHPGLRERTFALRPLVDLVPDATDPRDGTAYREILALLGPLGVREIAGSRVTW
jgi:2-amino-4-hydroxy-6-hydroxymethyldihydropteridine diphosphokinase